MSTQPLKEVKPRKAKARKPDVVFGCLDERLQVMTAQAEDLPGILSGIERVEDLLDELRRGLKLTPEAE